MPVGLFGFHIRSGPSPSRTISVISGPSGSRTEVFRFSGSINFPKIYIYDMATCLLPM